MYFATAGIEVSPWVPPVVAFVVSFFTSMGGVSGAFLLLPFQMTFLGYTAPSVSATNQLFNIVAIPSGVLRYIREGRMVWPLTMVVVLGTLPGVLAGAVIRVAWLPDPSHFKLFAALVLAWIGVKMVRELLGRTRPTDKSEVERRFQESVSRHRQKRQEAGEPLPSVQMVSLSWRRMAYEFYGERFEFSVPGIFLLSLVVGVVGGVYGIGGGSIIAPFFVTYFGLPVYTVAGAALMGTFITSVAGGGVLPGDRPPLPPHVRGPGLASGPALRGGRHGRDVPGGQVPEIRAVKGHQVDVGRDHPVHGREVCGGVFGGSRSPYLPVLFCVFSGRSKRVRYGPQPLASLRALGMRIAAMAQKKFRAEA